jgi:LuxR family transcriptional regulator, maltose regulon positive regulatory protein
MSTPILTTKLYIPPHRPKVVFRPRLIERLNEGRGCKLTLISAPAGFGKTTLLSEWVNQKDEGGRPAPSTTSGQALSEVQGMKDESGKTPHPSQVAWLSLDEGDNDPARFLTYFIAALQTLGLADGKIGEGALRALQSPQPPSTESILTALLNEISAAPDHFTLVLDDYHLIDAQPVDNALTFLVERLPPRMRLVIATREDPQLPLPRLRARGQLVELRAADLRFTLAEAADFLNQAMGLNLSPEAVAALENRTEGWIAGLQLAAISMQGRPDAGAFIDSFTGSHRFVMDYLVEEVLQRQPEAVQTFLLRTSILDRLCGPLCDAVMGKGEVEGQAFRLHPFDFAQDRPSSLILEYLERANLFIVPLDNERRWYRYHHLFADLLRQRLPRHLAATTADPENSVNKLHIRASQWYEENRLDIEAFNHATAANDIDRAERLIDGRGIPLHLRGAAMMIVNWLASLPTAVKNARPSLWWRQGAMLLVVGQTSGVAEKLTAAEAALQGAEPGADDAGATAEQTRLLTGRIATARAVLALTRYDAAEMLAQSRRALAYLPAASLPLHANAHWVMGFGHFVQGNRAEAGRSYGEAIAIGQAAGDMFAVILATIGLGNVQEADTQLHQAAETFRRVLSWAGDQPLQIIHDAHLGLARILYEWNDLAAAEQHGRHSLQLARQYDRVIDRFILCELFLARLKLAQGDLAGAAAIVAQAHHDARQRNFSLRLPDVAAAQVTVWLRQGNLAAAAELAQRYDLPLSQARVRLAQGETAAALALLEPYQRQAAARGWADEQLKALTLLALAYQAQGEMETAVQRLADALTLAEPGGFIRLFVDEGLPMAELLERIKGEGGGPALSKVEGPALSKVEGPALSKVEGPALSKVEGMKAYVDKLLAAYSHQQDIQPFDSAQDKPSSLRLRSGQALSLHPLIEPLSQRELEVLQLIAQGLSNREIGERLFLALSTVKGHNRIIFDKLQVQRRTEAVARARELGLL